MLNKEREIIGFASYEKQMEPFRSNVLYIVGKDTNLSMLAHDFGQFVSRLRFAYKHYPLGVLLNNGFRNSRQLLLSTPPLLETDIPNVQDSLGVKNLEVSLYWRSVGEKALSTYLQQYLDVIFTSYDYLEAFEKGEIGKEIEVLNKLKTKKLPVRPLCEYLRGELVIDGCKKDKADFIVDALVFASFYNLSACSCFFGTRLNDQKYQYLVEVNKDGCIKIVYESRHELPETFSLEQMNFSGYYNLLLAKLFAQTCGLKVEHTCKENESAKDEKDKYTVTFTLSNQ